MFLGVGAKEDNRFDPHGTTGPPAWQAGGTVRTVRPLTGRSALGLVLAAALVLALAGCFGNSDAREAPAPTATTPLTTMTAPTTTAAPSDQREAAVLAAYRAFWDDLIAVGATADWRSPRLADHATGKALAAAQATYRLLHRRGLVARGTVTVRAKVLSIKGNTATLYDCNSTAHFLAYDRATGKLRDTSSGRSNGKTVTLVRMSGAWKVANTVTEVGKCTR